MPKRFLFYLGHPAHFHLFKNVIRILKEKGNEVMILIKKKDVLEDLVMATGWKYANINPKGRQDDKISIALALLHRDWQIIKVCLKFKPSMMLGTAVEITHAGKLLGIKSLFFNEDDDDVIPLAAKIAFPFADSIICPDCCRIIKWGKKKIGYEGYHELAYLHPDYFTPDKDFIKEINTNGKYFIIRFAKLTAHHDKGIEGINDTLALRICELLEPCGKVYITSERELSGKLEKYRINIKPQFMHHVLYYAQMLIADSQTMSAEAGVLGTPFIRFNDFVDRISYLDELEKKYHLGYGIKPAQEHLLLDKIKELAASPDLKEQWKIKRDKMLSEKIDVVKFFTWLIENYPSSANILKENHDAWKVI